MVWGAAKAELPDGGDGCILGVTLAGWFERHGCPDQDVKVLYHKVSLDGTDVAVLDKSNIIATGVFMPRLKGIGHNDEWRRSAPVLSGNAGPGGSGIGRNQSCRSR